MTVTTDQLKEILAATVKAHQYQTAAWQKVTVTGRQYAQMKTTCSYMENGHKVTISKSEQSSMEQYFLDNLKRDVLAAFLEDALLGAAVSGVAQ